MTTTAPGPGDGLDAALARWADSVRLPADIATDMLTAILATPAPRMPRPRPAAAAALPGSWWRTYSADLAATLVRSVHPQPVPA